MRKKIISQLSFFDHALNFVFAFITPEKGLKKISELLDDNPKILNEVHKDLTKDRSRLGRKGLSAERILRCALLKQYKRLNYRELAERINDCVSFRWFTRFNQDKVPHFTALQKAIKAISPETWELVNDELALYAKEKKIENGRYARADTSVGETDIAYPIDARLLNDSVRVLTRIMKRCREAAPDMHFSFHDRTRSSKKKCYQIVMAKGKNAKQKRKSLYRKLLTVANEVFAMACKCLKELETCPVLEAAAQYEELERFVERAAVAIVQCERRVLKGEKVPAEDKIVSIFEDHTDIIKRGKSQCPTEFGHKISVVTGKSGLITQYDVLKGNPSDGSTLERILGNHIRQYDRAPRHFSADRRYYSAKNEELLGERGVKRVSIKKPGYRSKTRKAFEKQGWFKSLQKFRAGIEGIISGLMRGVGLKRCLWKGRRSFESYVGLSVVAFNLSKLAQLL
jgi:IS5 family transposase